MGVKNILNKNLCICSYPCANGLICYECKNKDLWYERKNELFDDLPELIHVSDLPELERSNINIIITEDFEQENNLFIDPILSIPAFQIQSIPLQNFLDEFNN